MEEQRLKILLDKYETGRLNQTEAEELDNWFHALNHGNTGLEAWIREAGNEDKLAEALFINFKEKGEIVRKRVIGVRWLAVAASVILLIGFGVYNQSKKVKTEDLAQQKVIAPGGNRAMLTLGDGEQILLNDVEDGQLATQSNVAIVKTADGKVTYTQATDNPDVPLLYNTLSTPRGGQYALTLSDGTRVWLNAASSIKYPAVFTGNERYVELSGEAYFEVTHNAIRPFKVTVAGQTIVDLGTHFNINAYKDEPAVRTTLLEGKVQIIKGSENVILKPGEQGSALPQGIKIKPVDTLETVAWKNGLFKFRNAGLPEVMRQLSRWYNVDIRYEGTVPQKKFTGEVTRNTSLSEMLGILSYLKVHFTVAQQDNKATITVINN